MRRRAVRCQQMTIFPTSSRRMFGLWRISSHIRRRATSPSSDLPSSSLHNPMSVAIAVSVLALFVVIGFFAWTSVSQPDERSAPATAQAELQKLNRVCGSLLVTIREVDSGTNAQANQQIDQEMEWPTGTDSLIPFDTLAFNARNLP